MPSPDEKPPIAVESESSQFEESIYTARQDSTLIPMMSAISEHKKRVGRRIRWAILLVPAVLILVTLSTRRVAVFDSSWIDTVLGVRKGWSNDSMLASPSAGCWADHGQQGHLPLGARHKRSPYPQTQALTLSKSASPSDSSLSQSRGATPTTTIPQTSQTIPPAPPAASPPVLPTPFPQPYDSVGATTNLSTQACQQFFVNMTQSDSFRKCRPLSLLLEFGSSFIQVRQTFQVFASSLSHVGYPRTLP